MYSQSETSIKYYNPKDLNELDNLIKIVDYKLDYIAGATDMLVQDKKWQKAQTLVSLDNVQELKNTIEVQNNGILIGAAAPMTNIIENPYIKDRLPIMVEACQLIGSVQIQNRATLGGNIANASPAGDSLPVLSVLEADLWIGPRINGDFEKMKLSQVMTGPGETTLNNNRYIAFIYIPFPERENQFWYFRKVGQREAMAISKLSLAIIGWRGNEKIENVRICAGSVTAQIKRAVETEKFLIGNILTEKTIESARLQIMEEVAPITDIRSTSDYRKKICGELLREALYIQMSLD
ncbi:FAD binding domain-containing protein [Calditrichota bacterium]